jgi:hypothetical protein
VGVLDGLAVVTQVVDVAEPAKGLDPRVVIWNALRDQARDAHFDVETHFLVELAREPLPRIREAEDPPDAWGHSHRHLVSRIRPTAFAYRRHVAVSARSWARPRAVSE